MWTQSAEEKLKELRFSKKQLEELSDKTMVGVGIITNVLLEAKNQGLIVEKNELNTSNDTDIAPDIDKVSSFNVTTYSLLDKDEKFCHWSKGLNMFINKEGVSIKLNSEEIQEIIKSLPKTIGGRY